MARILESMRATHFGIRELIARTFEKPASVDALALSRLQIEIVYSLCLMVENESFVAKYLKYHWKQLYVRHLLQTAECQGLPRFGESIRGAGHQAIEAFRVLSGVSEAEQLTIRNEELGIPFPPGITPTAIPHFPSPLKALRLIQDPSRKVMLGRLYFEYQHLCSFAHGAAQSILFKTFLDDRASYSQFFDTAKTRDLYDKDVAGPAVIYSLIGVAQSAAEILTIYRGDIDLNVAVSESWQFLSEFHLIGCALWEIRSRTLLGVISPATAGEKGEKAENSGADITDKGANASSCTTARSNRTASP